MWILICFGFLPGLVIACLLMRSSYSLAVRVFLSITLVALSYYFLNKLVAGPPLFYWQPTLMIPNAIFLLTPLVGALLGVLFLSVKPAVLPVTATVKYRNSTVTSSELDSIQLKLHNLCERDQVYLRDDLSLEDLANMLHSDRHTVSRLINERFGKNFFNFINSHRIQHFIELVSEGPLHQGFSETARQAGFRTKTSFFKAFKREKHLTPAKYFRINSRYRR